VFKQWHNKYIISNLLFLLCGELDGDKLILELGELPTLFLLMYPEYPGGVPIENFTAKQYDKV